MTNSLYQKPTLMKETHSTLSLLIITRNCDDVLEDTLKSVVDVVDHIIVIDDYSSDNTVEIATRYGAHVYPHHEYDLGKQRAYALTKATTDWILTLDSDERLSKSLQEEIKGMMTNPDPQIEGYYIPFHNHFLGKPIRHGGENYQMLRLFKRSAGSISDALVHERYAVTGSKTAHLTHAIDHYSYRSIPQLYIKFTGYALREAHLRIQTNDKLTLTKLFLYGPHMFYARFIKDKGYKDGLFRMPLDLAFGYMEGLTYWLVLLLKAGIIRHRITNETSS